jgi:hypothetical protein
VDSIWMITIRVACDDRTIGAQTGMRCRPVPGVGEKTKRGVLLNVFINEHRCSGGVSL